MNKIPLVDLKAQYLSVKDDVLKAMGRICEDTSFILGPEVAAFEAEFSKFIGAKATAGVASGTSALHLALLALGVKPGDEVITSAHTFIATVEAIFHAGAKPVFVDIDPKTFCLDPNLVEQSITDQTKVILPVHLYGHSADMTPIRQIANRYQLHVIEDAAQSHGARYHGEAVGTMGSLACFSFYPGKNLGAFGDAGAVTGNDESLLKRIRSLRDHGRLSKYEHQEIGYGERIDALQAAVLRVKLAHLEAWTEGRRTAAAKYKEQLKDLDVILPTEAADCRHVYHLFVVRAPRRDELLQYLKDNQIEAGVHYPIPLHRQPALKKLGYSDNGLPHTEKAAAEIVSLPLFPEITDDQIGQVASTIRNFYKGRA